MKDNDEVKWINVMTLHDKEMNLVQFIRKIGYGEITIKVQDGLPIMIEKSTEKVKL